MPLPHTQAPSCATVPKPDLVVFCTRHQQRLRLLPLCAACMVHGIQSEHSLSVARQAGGAAHVCEAEDADDLAVGGDSDVGRGLGGAQEPDVCHLIIVANQLLGQLQPAFLQKTTAACLTSQSLLPISCLVSSSLPSCREYWQGVLTKPGVTNKQPNVLIYEARLYSAVAAQVSGEAVEATALGAFPHILGLHASVAVQMNQASMVCVSNLAVQEHSSWSTDTISSI